MVALRGRLGYWLLIFFICRGMGIEIGRFILPANMLVLDMSEYDAIIGMDWLVMYRAMIDCYNCSIVFTVPGQEMFLVAMPHPEGVSSTQLYYINECLKSKSLNKNGQHALTGINSSE